jgi:CubicO group peptidase (beta-lactamase class C family)
MLVLVVLGACGGAAASGADDAPADAPGPAPAEAAVPEPVASQDPPPDPPASMPGPVSTPLQPPAMSPDSALEPPPDAVGPVARTVASLTTTANFVEIDPAAVGLDAAALARVDSLILKALADSAAPGAALAIGRRGSLVRLRGYGTLDWVDDRPVSPATLFDLASLTKVVGTATAAMLLEADGKLELDAPVVRYLPWWAGRDDRKRAVTVRQLLLHRSGLVAFRPWFRDHAGPAEYREALSDERLEYDPGTRTLYSDMGFLTLGMVLEAAAGMPLDSLLATRAWGPLGMDDTRFRPGPELLPRIAPTELDTLWRRQHVRGRVHDENADAFGGVAGHAGLFSTAWDLAIFADLMLSGGVAPACTPAVRSGVPCTRPRSEPLRLLPEETVRRWTTRAAAGASYALAWDTPEGPNSSAGDYFSARAFGHTGFTGTSIWIDPELDLYVVLLTNRVNPSRDNQRHVALRRAVHDAVARAVRDRPVVPRP